MDCSRARELILDERRGTLPPEQADELRGHLSTCARCRSHAEAERALSEVLEAKLPRYAAPVALQQRLEIGRAHV
jgi:anti-sigma factor RsiW